MASTISNATLTVTVTESLTLNGSNHGSTKRIDVTGVNEVSKRIISCLTTGTQIYKGHETVHLQIVDPTHLMEELDDQDLVQPQNQQKKRLKDCVME